LTGLAKQRLQQIKRKDFLEGAALVDGVWLPGLKRSAVIDPATNEEIGSAAHCQPADVEEAIDAAERAMSGWRALLPEERGAKLRSWAALMRSNSEDLAVIMTCEQGKPLREARSEVAYAAGFLDWFAAEGERAYGVTIPSHKRASVGYVRLQPIGVVAAITPWNFPSAMITRKAAAALAAGCTVIVKPAPETPLSALALARLAEEAGLPSGVFQVVTGDAAELVAILLDDTRVRALSFTGSTNVGRLLLERGAATVKKISLELGGHAPFVVFDDASLETAVKGCMAAKFVTSGQDCLAANRIYVQRGIHDRFVAAFAAAASRLKMGHGLDPTTDVGPMTKVSGAEKCHAQVVDALALGARLVVGGEASKLGRNFVTPTLLADVTDSMVLAHEETFGPIAAVLRFDSEQEVIARANACETGLAGYIYTDDLRRGLRMSESLECGMVGVNTPSFTGPPIPFGGWKQSGLGREGSQYGLGEFMQLKYVCFGDLTA